MALHNMEDDKITANVSDEKRQEIEYRESLLLLESQKQVTWHGRNLDIGTGVLDLFENDPNQPRGDTITKKSLEEKAASLESVGQLQPICVHKYNLVNKKFKIIFGETRWRAAYQTENIKNLDFIVCEQKDEETNEEFKIRILTMQLAENMQRTNVPALQQAAAIVDLIKKVGSRDEVSKLLGKSSKFISNASTSYNAPLIIKKFLNEIGTVDLQVSAALVCAYKKKPKKTDELMEKYKNSIERGVSPPNLRVAATNISTGKGARNSNKVKIAKAKLPNDIIFMEEHNNIIMQINEKGENRSRYKLSSELINKIKEGIIPFG